MKRLGSISLYFFSSVPIYDDIRMSHYTVLFSMTTSGCLIILFVPYEEMRKSSVQYDDIRMSNNTVLFSMMR